MIYSKNKSSFSFITMFIDFWWIASSFHFLAMTGGFLCHCEWMSNNLLFCHCEPIYRRGNLIGFCHYSFYSPLSFKQKKAAERKLIAQSPFIICYYISIFPAIFELRKKWIKVILLFAKNIFSFEQTKIVIWKNLNV